MKEIAKIKLYVQFVIQLWLDSGKRLLGLLKLPPEKNRALGEGALKRAPEEICCQFSPENTSLF